jgi:membrane protease subunit HflC
MRANRLLPILIGALVALMLVYSSLFVVDQRYYAIVLTFQSFKQVVNEPGLHAKWPYPIDQVVYIDKRNQTIDSGDTDRYITAEKQNLQVDLFVKWQVTDPRQYYVSFRGDSTIAQERLLQIIRAALNEEFAKRTVRELIATQREDVMHAVREKVGASAASLGVAVVDVRLKRVDLLPEISERVYQRMVSERNQRANAERSNGYAEEEQIKADADRQREVILAEAYKTAQTAKGEGDAQAAQIYAEAYSRDPQFYSFYKSLEAYRESFKNHGDIVVADPNSDFFKFMKSPSSATPPRK